MMLVIFPVLFFIVLSLFVFYLRFIQRMSKKAFQQVLCNMGEVLSLVGGRARQQKPGLVQVLQSSSEG
jgi:hypothetical protein